MQRNSLFGILQKKRGLNHVIRVKGLYGCGTCHSIGTPKKITDNLQEKQEDIHVSRVICGFWLVHSMGRVYLYPISK